MTEVSGSRRDWQRYDPIPDELPPYVGEVLAAQLPYCDRPWERHTRPERQGTTCTGRNDDERELAAAKTAARWKSQIGVLTGEYVADEPLRAALLDIDRHRLGCRILEGKCLLSCRPGARSVDAALSRRARRRHERNE